MSFAGIASAIARSAGRKGAKELAHNTIRSLGRKYGRDILETGKDWLLDTIRTADEIGPGGTKDLSDPYLRALYQREAPTKRARRIVPRSTTAGGTYAPGGSYGGKIKYRKFRRLTKRRVRRYKRRIRYIGKAVRPLYTTAVDSALLSTEANQPWCSYVHRVDAVGIQDFITKSIIPPVGQVSKHIDILYGGQRGYFWFKNPYSFTLLIRVYKGYADVDELGVGTDAAGIAPQTNSCFVWPQVRKGILKITNVRTVVLGAGDSQKVFFNLRCNKHLKILYDSSTSYDVDRSWRAPVICLQIYPDIMTNIASVADTDTLGFPSIKAIAFILKITHYGSVPNDLAVLDPRINRIGITRLTAPLTTFDVKQEDKMADATF